MPQDAVPKNAFDFDTGFDADFDIEVTEVAKPEAKKPGDPLPASAVSQGREEVPVGGGEKARDGQQHTPMSIHFAKEFGFTDQEIADLSPKELDNAVKAAHRAWLRSSADLRRNEIKQGDAPKPVSEPKPEVKTEEEDDLKEFEDVLAPQVIQAIKKVRGKDAAKIEALQKKVEESEGRVQSAQREQLYNAIDAEFAKMPAEVKSLIGEGDRTQIENGSLQHTIRKHILATAEKDETPGLSFAQKMHKAAAALTPKAAPAKTSDGYEAADEVEAAPAAKPAPAKDPVTGKFAARTQAEREQAWKDGGSAKPTHRENPEPKGESKALRTARKIMLERGMLDEHEMPDGSFPK